MKRWIVFCFALFALKSGFAQKMDDKTQFKKLSGPYGRASDGICLFEDGTFLLYGYATAVFGKYNFVENHIKFTPDKPPLFEVYATVNTSLTDSVRINFKGFDRNHGTYLQLGNELTNGVFNADANCFDAPFVYQTKKWSGKTVLSSFLKDEFWYRGDDNASWEYQLPNNFNDFIFVYNAPSRYNQQFEAVIESGVLKTDAYGGDKGFAKKAFDSNNEDWKEILSWKKQYDLEKANPNDLIYANKYYRVFSAPKNDYVFDSKSNRFVAKNIEEKELYYLQNQYNDDRYLRKYVKLKPVSKKGFDLEPVKLATTTIFYTVCGEDSEKSYHYNGYEPIPEAAGNYQTTTLQTIPNMVIEKLEFKFYFLKFSEVAQEVAKPKTALFTQSDVVEVSKIEKDKHTFTLSLKLNPTAIKKVSGLKNEPKDEILMMLGNKEIKTSNFKVIDDTIQLLAEFTLAEIEEIFKQLAK